MIVSLAVTAMVLSVMPLVEYGWVALRYDDRPAVTVHEMTVLTPVVSPGGTLRYQSIYSKRAECHPPLGSGEVSYRLYGSSAADATRHAIYDFDLRREARWPPGERLTFETSVRIPADIPPGTYRFVNVTTYECRNGSAKQTVRSPGVEFTVQ